MVVRFYIMPKTSQVVGARTMLAPKYHSDIVRAAGVFSGIDWPGWYLLRVEGSISLQATLGGYADTTQTPADLSATLSGRLTAVESALESSGIPGDWLTAGMTWREVLKGIGQIAQFHHRVKEPGLLTSGRSLSTTWTQLPAGIRTKIQAAAASWGMRQGSIRGTSTLRQVLRAMGAQYPGRIALGGEVL